MSERLNILGVGVSPLNMGKALAQLESWIQAGERHYVCICNVHSIMECRRSETVRHVFNRAGMVTPDGMPLVWLLRRSGYRDAGRVYGPDLMLATMPAFVAKGYRHYFHGGVSGVADRLAAMMRERFPGVAIAGTSTPAFGTAAELCNAEIAEQINAARPDIVWVGMSSPKQDEWMACIRPLLQAPVLIGVGAAFDFHIGRVKQAPRWMMRSGLEWLFRLTQEPRRLWRRYLVDNPWFLYEIAQQQLGLKRFELD